MATSRYDFVPQQPDFQVYTPLPYEALYGAVNRKQAELDKAKEQDYQLQNLAATIKTDKYGEQYLKPQVMARYTDRFNQLSDTIARGDDYNYKREVNKLVRDYTMDQDVQNLKRSGQEYDRYLEARKKDPDAYVDFYDNYENDWRKRLEGYKSGEPVPFYTFEGLKGKQDYVKKASDLISNIQEDSIGWENYQRNADGTPKVNNLNQVTRLDGKKESISEAKRNRVANSLVPVLLSTSEGQYFVDELLGRDTSIPGNEITQEDLKLINDNAYNLFQRIGEKQIYSKTDSGIDLQNLPEYLSGGAGGKDATFNRFEIDTPSNITPQDALNYGNQNVMIKNGKIVHNLTPEGAPEEDPINWGNVFTSIGPANWIDMMIEGRDPNSTRGTDAKKELGKLVKYGTVANWIAGKVAKWVGPDEKVDLDKIKEASLEDQKLFNIVSSRLGSTNLTKKQLDKGIKEYGDYIKSKSQSSKINILNDIAVAKDERYDYSNKEFNNIFFAPDKEGKATDNGSMANLRAIRASDGETFKATEKLKGKKVNVVGALNNNNPYGPGWRQVQADGETFYVPGSDQESVKNSPEWSFHQTNYNMLGQSKVPVTIRNQTVIVDVQKTPVFDKQGNETVATYTFIDPRNGEEIELTNAPSSEVAYQHFINYLR